MDINETYQHRYNKAYSCTITAITNKGARVSQFDASNRTGKAVTGYYNRIDFDPVAGFWLLITPTLELGIEPQRPQRPQVKQESQRESQILLF
jgi:hypothetical protein